MNKRMRTSIRWTGASTLVLASLLANTASAQINDTPSQIEPASVQANDSNDQRSLETVVITGSRISNANLTSSSSVSVLDGDEVDVRGVTRVEDLLSTLPQVGSGDGSTSGVGGAQATVNLRGLGANRTLVLVDGKRLPYGSPINVAADLNQIPSQLIDRVEVLTGGATAVYGSDAVAGVVNFIMKRDFDGLEVDVQGGIFQASNNNSNIERVLADFNQPDPDSIFDGEAGDFNIVAGRNFDDGRGNITAYYGYSKDNEVRWEDRDFTSCPFGVRDGGEDFSCSGSGSQPRNTRYSRTGADGFNLVVDETTGELRNFDGSTDAFNFALGNYLQRPRERSTYGAFVRYDVTDNVEFFMDFSVADNRTEAQIAAGGLTLGRTSSINCDNPLLSAAQLARFCDAGSVFVDNDGVTRAPLRIGRRNLDFARVNNFELKTQRVVGGIRGEILDGIDYELFAQRSMVDYTELLLNDVSTSRVTLAIDVVSDPVTGNPICRSVLTGEDPNCIPFDVFSPNGITEAASNYVTVPTLRVGDTEQTVVGGTLAGNSDRWGFSSPFAADGIGAVVGFEYRKDSLSLRPDSSDTGTSQRVAVAGEVPVVELFTEVQAPIIQNKPFAEELTLSAAYRYSDYYDTSGGQDTYSFGASWRPVSDVRVRAQYQRATRSPNPIELFSPQEFGRDTLSTQPNGLRDPCAGDFDATSVTPEPFRSLADCAQTGVTSAQYGTILDSTGNIDTFVGGSPDLEPEISNTWTGGVVFEPSAVPGFVASVDYFSIEVDGFIGSVDPSEALGQCLDSGDASFCNLISRDSAGTLFLIPGEAFIRGTLINTGVLKTSGFDVSASYGFDLDRFGWATGGDVKLGYAATFLSELTSQSLPGSAEIDCAGFHGAACDNPAPDYRHRASIGWVRGDLAATLSWRYISAVDQFSSSPTAVNQLDATSYFDVAANYQISEKFRVRGGINNAFDQDPPLTSLAGFGGGEGAGRGNSYPQVYDAQGRYIFVGATLSF